MAEHNYTFDVTMTCGGCSGAVDRVLKRLDGVKSHDISLEQQKVNVVAGDDLSYDKVLETIKKTGKQVRSGEADGKPMAI